MQSIFKLKFSKIMKQILIVTAFAVLTFLNAKGQNTEKLKIAVLVYPGVELLDFSGPVEVFSNVDKFEVFLVSTGEEKITTKNKTLTLIPDFTIENAPTPDILVVPGAPMNPVYAVSDNTKVIDWIRQINTKTRYTMSVCTGAFILNSTGILEGKTITSHVAVIKLLTEKAPKSTVLKDGRWVEDGKIITTAGISAGIDGALHLVEKIEGIEAATMVTKIMQYQNWKKDDGFIVGKSQALKEKPLVPSKNKRVNTTTSVKKDEPLKEATDDVVCKMPVKAGETITKMYNGKQYGFCSHTCKDMFIKNPKKYLTAK